MSTVQEIEDAIRQLPAEDLAAIRAWFAEFDAAVWDRQIEQDAAAGRLDGGRLRSLLPGHPRTMRSLVTGRHAGTACDERRWSP